MNNEEKIRKKIGEYYDKHKNKIYDTLSEGGISDPKYSFVNRVLSVKYATGKTTEKAIQKVMHSTTFTPKAQIFAENALSAIRKDRNAYELFRKWTRHQKIIYENFEYIGNNKYLYYTPTKIILIDISNSPKAVYLAYENRKEKEN